MKWKPTHGDSLAGSFPTRVIFRYLPTRIYSQAWGAPLLRINMINGPSMDCGPRHSAYIVRGYVGELLNKIQRPNRGISIRTCVNGRLEHVRSAFARCPWSTVTFCASKLELAHPSDPLSRLQKGHLQFLAGICLHDPGGGFCRPTAAAGMTTSRVTNACHLMFICLERTTRARDVKITITRTRSGPKSQCRPIKVCRRFWGHVNAAVRL